MFVFRHSQMKSNRDLLQGLTILNTDLLFTYGVSTLTPYRNLPLHVRVSEVVGRTHTLALSAVQGLFS